MSWWVGGWVDGKTDGWIGGWMDVKAVLKITYSNQQNDDRNIC